MDDEKKREDEQCCKSNLAQFWRHLSQHVRTTKDGHMLRDMAQVELTLPQSLVPDDTEERVSLSTCLHTERISLKLLIWCLLYTTLPMCTGAVWPDCV